jgi:hypothetical protein
MLNYTLLHAKFSEIALSKLLCPIKSGPPELICKLEDYRTDPSFNTGKRQIACLEYISPLTLRTNVVRWPSPPGLGERVGEGGLAIRLCYLENLFVLRAQ